MSAPPFTLVSHALCPYVQRVAIVLAEKGVPCSRRWVDLADKPAWFRALSPLGRTPVLLVGDVPVFESAVICEYLEDTCAPRLHPDDPLQRARERAWIEVASTQLSAIAGYYGAPDAAALEAQRQRLVAGFALLEQALDANGPFFAGQRFSLVDAAFAPVFRYFDVFEALGVGGFFDDVPRVRAWRAAMSARPSVQSAAGADHHPRLERFLRDRGSELSRRIAAPVSAPRP